MRYYLFVVSLDRCSGIANNLLSKIGAWNKEEDVDLNVFNMITRIKKTKKCKCKLDDRICNLNEKSETSNCVDASAKIQ